MNIVYSVFYAGAVVVLTVAEMKQEVVTEWQLKGPEKDEKWKQYDEKLSEHRRKLEKAEHDEKMRQEEEAKKQKDLDYLKALEDNSRSNTQDFVLCNAILGFLAICLFFSAPIKKELGN
jgi:uncharacterized membrane protein YukC